MQNFYQIHYTTNRFILQASEQKKFPVFEKKSTIFSLPPESINIVDFSAFYHFIFCILSRVVSVCAARVFLLLPFVLAILEVLNPRLNFIQMIIGEHEYRHDCRNEYRPDQNPPPGVERNKLEGVTSPRHHEQARNGDDDQKIFGRHGGKSCYKTQRIVGEHGQNVHRVQ